MLIQNRYDETRIIDGELIAAASPRKNMKGEERGQPQHFRYVAFFFNMTLAYIVI